MLIRAKLKLIYFNCKDKEKHQGAAGWSGKGMGFTAGQIPFLILVLQLLVV